jgi:hypothetical protein
MNTRPTFFEPYPKMPEQLVASAYALRTIVYENGQMADGLDLYTMDEKLAISEEISNLFNDHRFRITYYSDYATFIVRYEDDEIPKEWLQKTVVVGHPKKERELLLVGDRIPINVAGHPTLQVRFID